MDFLFVDETGDPGREGSKCFGLALLQVNSKCYMSIRRLLFSYRLLSGMFPEVKDLPQKPIAHLNLLRGISSLVEAGLVQVSGIYIYKERYGGRYLKWIDSGYAVAETEWRYYLRNYLLRHLLEMHFSDKPTPNEDTDLVLDRVMLTEAQRANTLSYLNGKTQIALRQPFVIPKIIHLTIADSEYVGALQLVHIIADLVKTCAIGNLSGESEKLSRLFRIVEFIGHKNLTE
jgi:hypothetical protein